MSMLSAVVPQQRAAVADRSNASRSLQHANDRSQRQKTRSRGFQMPNHAIYQSVITIILTWKKKDTSFDGITITYGSPEVTSEKIFM